MSAKHTPGPLTLRGDFDDGVTVEIVDIKGVPLIEVYPTPLTCADSAWTPGQIRNAYLFSAAHDLYAALELMADAWDMPDTTKAQRAKRGKAWRAMRSALAKADGKPEPDFHLTTAEARNA